MNNDSLHLEHVDHDLGLSFQDRIDILYHEIELAVRWDRPSILFAIYKSDFIRDEVNTLLREKLKTISQKTYSIKTSFKNQFDFLSQVSQLPELSQTVLLIDGFNWECGTEGVRVFKEFNKNREYFIDNNIRAIFWLFENEVSNFAANATECWILRHRVVEFVDVPQQDQSLIQSLEALWQNADSSINDAQNSNDASSKDDQIIQGKENENTSRANALLNLGVLFWRKGNPQRALKYLNKSEGISGSLSDHSLQAQCQNALALVHAELGNIDKAVSAYHSALVLAPESEFLWNNLGQLLAKNERNEEALSAFNKALSCSPRDFLSWDGIGQIYNKFGVYQNAISAFEKALEIAPYHESSWVGLGRAYLESDQSEKAESSLRKAVELNTHLIDAWINLSRCYAKQMHDLEAVAVCQKAIELNPDSAELWDELGKLHLHRRNFTESISAFQKVISLNPRCSEAHVRLAHALFQIGDYETSASIYVNSIPLFDDNVTRSALWNRLGDTYLYMKDYENAIEAYKQSEQIQKELTRLENVKVDLSNDTEENHLNNAPIEIDLDNSEEQRGDNMIEANQIFDLKTAAEWNEHGNSHLKAGAYNDAIVAYTKAIELAPDACWPYIQNLAQVHYLKGKARGKNAVGKIEDPDIWEAEDESDSTNLLGFDALTNPDNNDAIEEPRLEKSTNKNTSDRSLEGEESGKTNSNNSTPFECCQNKSNEQILESKQVISSDINEKGCNKIEESLEIDTRSSEIEKTPASQVLENPPKTSIDWNEMGNSFISSKKFDDAIKAYKTAIELDPKYGQPYSNLGYLYFRLGNFDFAIRLYKKSIDLLDSTEDKALSWTRLGDAYRRIGDYENALVAYQKSGEMVPTMSPVMARARVTLLDNIVAG